MMAPMRSKLAWNRREIAAGVRLAFMALLGTACNPITPPVGPPPVPTRSDPAANGDKVPRVPGGAEILGPEASAVSFERMAKFPEPGWHVPRRIAYSPDGKLVTFLQSESQSEEMALFAFDTATKSSRVVLRAGDLQKQERTLSREEELRRERQRKRIQGVTDYAWAKRAPVMVIPFGGDVFVRGQGGETTRLTDTPAPEIDPQICEGGEKVAFVRDGELFVVDVGSKKETQLTRGAPAGVTRGLSDFNGQEEFEEQSGFWLSPACDRVAYLEVDERGVATHPVMGYRAGKADLMQQRYPAAGEKNPVVRAGILDIATKRTAWLSWPSGAERYLGRFKWSADGKALWLQALDREQKRLSLVRADARTGALAEVVSETSPAWIEFADMRLLERSPRFLWTATTGGHRHLEVRDAATGAKGAALTTGAWDVAHIVEVDEDKGRVFVVGSRESPLEAHLYAVPLAGGEPERLTKEPGDHGGVVGPGGRGFVDVHSAKDRPPKAEVRDGGGAILGELPTPKDPDMDALKLRPLDTVTLKGPSGDTLFGELLRPRALQPGKRHPVVVMVYGGPGAQLVRNRWSPRLLWQHLADRGFVVFQLDNRGSHGRGPGFEAPLYGKLGDVELTDQIAGVEYLRALPFVDGKRIGIYGHSYGGYMAALALLKAPDHFQVGVAASPVTEWRLYDSGYTERYLGLPSKNAPGYDASSVNGLARNLRGKLLLVHAMMDENVHFQHTALLIDALVAADKPFDLLLFPGERHGYRSPDARRYASRRVVDYLVEHL
jgi:dipeptidyl-peptidase-4